MNVGEVDRLAIKNWLWCHTEYIYNSYINNMHFY